MKNGLDRSLDGFLQRRNLSHVFHHSWDPRPKEPRSGPFLGKESVEAIVELAGDSWLEFIWTSGWFSLLHLLNQVVRASLEERVALTEVTKETDRDLGSPGLSSVHRKGSVDCLFVQWVDSGNESYTGLTVSASQVWLQGDGIVCNLNPTIYHIGSQNASQVVARCNTQGGPNPLRFAQPSF